MGLCRSLAQAHINFASEIKKTKAMRNTDYSTDVLSNVISPDTNFQALKDLMKDLGLEMEDAVAL